MTYETISVIIQDTSKVKVKDMKQVIEKLYYQASVDDESIEYFHNINDLTEIALKQGFFEGDEDDFHNLSVVYAREDDFTNACDVLEKGLERYPYSIDLLADYLNYGIQCDRKQKCEEIYLKLMQVRDRWNWRAYQFSINYLEKKLSFTSSSNVDDIGELVEEFVNKLPNVEEAYTTKADFVKEYKKENSEADFLEILEYAVSDECAIQRTPKCDLKLADYYYSLGRNLIKASELIERCKRDSVAPQPSVNRQYVYLLSVLCKICLFYDNLKQNKCKKIQGEEENRKKILEIYDDYHVVAADRSDFQIQNCKELIEALIKETGVPYPYDDGIYNDL